MQNYLSLAFHQIVKTKKKIDSIYAIERAYFDALLSELSNMIIDGSVKQKIRIYFDDSYECCFQIAAPALESFNCFEKVIAVPVTTVGETGHCSLRQLEVLHDRGLTISSHGYTHAVLAARVNGEVQETPNSGRYKMSQRVRLRSSARRKCTFSWWKVKRHSASFRRRSLYFPMGCTTQAQSN